MARAASWIPSRRPGLSRMRMGSAALPGWLWPAGITLVAAVLRVLPWLANWPLHRDEALYGSWARLVAAGHDPLLLTAWIDKPPLSIYLIAGSISVLGASELALRLPGMIAGILTVPAAYALACRAYGRGTAHLVATLVALSPFAILFAPTAFTDPWLTLWLVVAAWAALARRPFMAGVALGLALASKQQGLLGAPLVAGLLLIPDHRDRSRGPGAPLIARDGPAGDPREGSGCSATCALRRLPAALLGVAVVFGPLTFWDSLRWHNRPSFWDRSLETYGQLVVAAPGEWPQRAAEWAHQLGYLFGFPLLSWLMLGLAAAAGIAAAGAVMGRRASEPRHLLDLVLAGYAAGYLALHVVVTFQPWDRYLLPLVPVVCLLAARGLMAAWDSVKGSRVPLSSLAAPAGAALVLAGALGYAAWLGAAGRLPVGSDHGAYTGITQVTDILRAQPGDAIIYHQSLGWYFDYYLFDTPQERRWYDSGSRLAADAAPVAESEPGRPLWLVLADWETASVATLQPELSARGLALAEAAPVHRPDGSRSFAMFRIAVDTAGGGQ